MTPQGPGPELRTRQPVNSTVIKSVFRIDGAKRGSPQSDKSVYLIVDAENGRGPLMIILKTLSGGWRHETDRCENVSLDDL